MRPRGRTSCWANTGLITTSVSASICAMCAVYATFLHEEQREHRAADWQQDRWEKECGARFVDDIWSGYARSFLRAHRVREHRECLDDHAEKATFDHLRAALVDRYPDNRLPLSAMPLASEERERVNQFWSDPKHGSDFSTFLSPFESMYPDAVGGIHEHWQNEVIARDMMHDLQTVYASRARGATDADASSCQMRSEKRQDVEKVFDDTVLKLFWAGDPCARMYIGFGNEEVRRLMDRHVRKWSEGHKARDWIH